MDEMIISTPDGKLLGSVKQQLVLDNLASFKVPGQEQRINCVPPNYIFFTFLGKKGLHLNFEGNSQLAKNIIEKLRTISF